MPDISKKTKKQSRLQNNLQNNLQKKLLLNGGRYLGKGSFGCVISPALQCNRKSKKKITKPKKI